MAINEKEFTEVISTGLKACKKYDKFLYRFKIDGKSFRKIFDYSGKDWDKRTKTSKAKADAFNFREDKKEDASDSSVNPDIKVNAFVDLHFKTMEESTSYSKNNWKKIIESHYKRYIKNEIGNKKVVSVRQMDIKATIQKIKKNGLSARTQKMTLEVLNPIFKSAKDNMLITHNPCDGVTVTRPDSRKKVSNASNQLKEIYEAIMLTFKDDMYFQAMFLFALQGRRKSEILTLEWKNIDFDNSTYTLPMTKNSEEQTFMLPDYVASLLLCIQTNKDGYVFASPTNPSKHIQNIKSQTNKLKKALNNPKFGIHYLRNVVVSAMAEQGVNATYLSGALGHSDLHTVKKYLSMPYQQGSQVANDVIEKITKTSKLK